MTLFYNWPKIKKHSNGNVQTIRTIYESMMETDRPALGRRKYDSMDFSGDSFFLKPDWLLWAFQNANQVHAANCLFLASRRNYAEYLLTGDATLPIKYVNIPIEQLKLNSLIEIRDNNIHFILEK